MKVDYRIAFFFILILGYSHVITNPPSTLSGLIVSISKGTLVASAIFLVPITVFECVKRVKHTLSIAIFSGSCVEFFWSVLAKTLNYPIHRDFLIAGGIGSLIALVLFIYETSHKHLK